MEHKVLSGFIDKVTSTGLGVHTVVVRHHGELIDRHDFIPAEGRVQLFSASKSWVSIAAGIAIGEGRFSVTDHVTDLLKGDLPEVLPQGFEKLTLWHLLTMSTGHSECPVVKMQAEIRKKMLEEDPKAEMIPGSGNPLTKNWLEAFCSEPLEFDPDSKHWVYNNGATYMAARVVEKHTGMNVRDYLMPRVFSPLGIEDPVWDTDPDGHVLGALGLHLNAEELSRGGQLLLNMGRWNDMQIIPEEYVAEMTRKHVDNTTEGADENASAGYGYQVWMCARPGSYRMDGLFSQLSIGIPDLDAVVAMTSHEDKNGPEIIRSVFSEIVPELEK